MRRVKKDAAKPNSKVFFQLHFLLYSSIETQNESLKLRVWSSKKFQSILIVYSEITHSNSFRTRLVSGDYLSLTVAVRFCSVVLDSDFIDHTLNLTCKRVGELFTL